MKLVARLYLFLFIAFLTTPTIVTLIEDETDTSVFFNMSEEEQVKKEVKNFVYFDVTLVTFEFKKTSQKSLILVKNLIKHDPVSRKIFSPPPNLA